MKTRHLIAFTCALTMPLLPASAFADAALPPAANASDPVRFDLRSGVPGASSLPIRLPARIDAVRQGDAPEREKIKIRWTRQLIDGGPRFEIGSYGSRKGAMKSKLIHVALDWTF